MTAPTVTKVRRLTDGRIHVYVDGRWTTTLDGIGHYLSRDTLAPDLMAQAQHLAQGVRPGEERRPGQAPRQWMDR